MNLYESIKTNLEEAGRTKKPDYINKLRRAGFDEYYYDDWYDYNEDLIKELFKKDGPEDYKDYSDAINTFAVDLMLQSNGKDLKREKTQEEKDYEKELKSLGINKKEFEEWLSLYEDKALNDYKGDPDKDNNVYMKYLYDLYLNHGDKYMDPENLEDDE